MGDWLSIFLIYITKLGIVEKPDVIDKIKLQIWNHEHQINQKIIERATHFFLLLTSVIYMTKSYLDAVNSEGLGSSAVCY